MRQPSLGLRQGVEATEADRPRTVFQLGGQLAPEVTELSLSPTKVVLSFHNTASSPTQEAGNLPKAFSSRTGRRRNPRGQKTDSEL